MSYRIRVLETGAVFDAQPGEALLAAAGRQGVRLPHECTFGGCGTCRVRLLEGRVAYEELPLALTEEEAHERDIAGAQQQPQPGGTATPAGTSGSTGTGGNR